MTRWVENILAISLGLQPGERLLVMCDKPLLYAGEALVAAGEQMGAAEAALATLPSGRLSLVSSALLQAVAQADVIVSLHAQLALHGEDAAMRAARSAFRQAGRGRWGVLAQVDEAVLIHELSADLEEVAAEAGRLAARLQSGSGVHLTSAVGTDLTFSYAGRPLQVETGLIRAPGSIGNLPGGEVYVAPLERSAEGRLVVDLCLGDIPLDRSVTLYFERGRVVRAEGSRAAEELRSRLGEEPWAWTMGEFGLGANRHIVCRGRVALDEKALGTAHIALGANLAFGGANPAATHYDCVLAAPHVVVI